MVSPAAGAEGQAAVVAPTQQPEAKAAAAAAATAAAAAPQEQGKGKAEGLAEGQAAVVAPTQLPEAKAAAAAAATGGGIKTGTSRERIKREIGRQGDGGHGVQPRLPRAVQQASGQG
jgi:hypothetical protein